MVVDQSPHPLSCQVVDSQVDLLSESHGVRDQGFAVERIRVVLAQLRLRRQVQQGACQGEQFGLLLNGEVVGEE